jgi:membrane protein YqaA with SNARE-associated domain
MVKNILDSLKMGKDMAKVNKYGKITLSMRVIGQMIRLMGKAGLFIQKEMFMKATGKMIRHMVVAYTTMWMDKNIQEDGLMI